ncbi:MAG: MFS transporter [Roseicyclus sp.]
MSMFADLRISRVPAGAFVGVGLFWGSFAAMLPALKARLDLSDSHLGLILLTAAAGALVAMALAPRVDAAWPRMGLTLSGLAMAFAVLPIGLADTFWIFAIGMVAIGTATGLYDILGNARVSRLEARHDLALMNLNHALYSFSYAAAAMMAGLAREAAIAPGLWFAIVAALILCAVALTWTARPQKGAAPDAPQNSRGPVSAFVWGAGLVVLIGFFAENATEGWSALHIERTLEGGAAQGALGPAMLGLTMGIGRLAGHMVTVRGGEMRVLFWSALIAAVGLGIAAVAPVPVVAYVGFGLLGLGVSVVGPLAIALAGQTAPARERTLAVSRAAMIGYFGFFLGPPLMGFMSEAFGLRVAFAMGAAMVLVIPVVLLPWMRRARRA